MENSNRYQCSSIGSDRKSILIYHQNDRDEIRRLYLQKNPCQPRNHVFFQTKMFNYMRRFNESCPPYSKSWLCPWPELKLVKLSELRVELVYDLLSRLNYNPWHK